MKNNRGINTVNSQEPSVKFPEWLDRLIVLQARKLLAEPRQPEAKTLVAKLVTDERMKPVWIKLTNNEIQPRGQMNILWVILDRLNYWDSMKDEGLLVPPTERRKRAQEITDAITTLREMLKKHHHLIWDYNPNGCNLIDKQLDTIEEGLEYSVYRNGLPTKINTDSAKRTFLIKELKVFMEDYYEKKFHAELATIIGLIFDDEEITESQISKA